VKKPKRVATDYLSNKKDLIVSTEVYDDLFMSYTHGDGKNKYSVPWKADSR
jgi:hypothetical protein